MKHGLVATVIYPVVFIVLLMPNVFSRHLQTPSNNQAPVISDADKAAIIRSALLDELSVSYNDRTRIIKPHSDNADPCSGSPKKRRVEFISEKNIRKELLPSIECVKLVVLSKSQIEHTAYDGFHYVVFDQIESRNGKVYVKLATVTQKPGYYGSAGSEFEYEKISDKWTRRLIGGYGSET